MIIVSQTPAEAKARGSGTGTGMNRALYPTIAIALAACMEPAAAQNISLICTLQSGNKLPLKIDGNRVLKDGHLLKNFEPKSFVAGPARIAFNQRFPTYHNAWSIDRGSLQIGFKTILKDGSHVVLEEKGSCTSAVPPQQAQRTPENGTGLQATIAAMLGR